MQKGASELGYRQGGEYTAVFEGRERGKGCQCPQAFDKRLKTGAVPGKAVLQESLA